MSTLSHSRQQREACPDKGAAMTGYFLPINPRIGQITRAESSEARLSVQSESLHCPVRLRSSDCYWQHRSWKRIVITANFRTSCTVSECIYFYLLYTRNCNHWRQALHLAPEHHTIIVRIGIPMLPLWACFFLLFCTSPSLVE